MELDKNLFPEVEENLIKENFFGIGSKYRVWKTRFVHRGSSMYFYVKQYIFFNQKKSFVTYKDSPVMQFMQTISG